MATSTARLEVVGGRAAGMSLLVADELLIGRAAEGAGKLADDEEISRSHARLSIDSSGYCAIEDLGSTNGTFVNGLRISAPQTLSEGDTVEIGESTLIVREVPTPEAQQAATPAAPQPTVVPGTPAVEPMATEPLEPALVPEPPEQEAPASESEAEPAGEEELEAAEVAEAVEAVAAAEVAEAVEAVAAEQPLEAAEEAAGEPAEDEAPASTPPSPRLSLRLELDFEAREVRVLVDDEAGPWRASAGEP